MEDFTKYPYSVKSNEKPEGADDTGAIIEKGAITAEFTVGEMRVTRERARKSVRELKGTLGLKEGIVANIAQHRPHIAAMSLEDLFAAHMYYEAKVLADNLPAKVKEFEDAIEESIVEEAHIVATLGLNVPPEGVPSAVSLAADAMANIEKGTAEVAPEPAPAPDAPAE